MIYESDEGRPNDYDNGVDDLAKYFKSPIGHKSREDIVSEGGIPECLDAATVLLKDMQKNPYVFVPGVKVKIKSTAKELPAYATLGSAGMDLCSAEKSARTLYSGDRVLFDTGIFLEIPPGVEGQIRPRSGLAMRHGIIIPNSPGTIDSDYRGEVKVLLMNCGSSRFVVNPGDRIAQLVFAQYLTATWDVQEVLSETERGDGGFGSTGV